MAMKLALVCAVVFVVASAGPGAQAPSAEELLRRTADYVADFVEGLSNVVAEEEYQQSFQSGPARRRLKSDFLLVKYPGMEKEFLAFRDVIEVNGQPVTDQQDRLLKLFIEPYNNPVARASEIANASGRHSVDRGRLANPLFVLAQLQSHYQPRFRFTLNGLASRLGPEVREVEMFEIRNPSPAQPPPIHALAWIEEGTGRVLKTELRLGRAPSTALTTTTFGTDPALGIDVPVEMRDSFVLRAADGPVNAIDQFTGVATYSRFRRFQVHAEEKIETPPIPR
jgi:hypothetical protein